MNAASARAKTKPGAALLLHASAVAIGGLGVLLRGRSGAGKSDLALRLIDGGAVLIGDDYVELRARGGRLLAAPPRTIAGLLEVRGLGIQRTPCRPGPIGLVVDLVAPGRVERLPKPRQVEFLGVKLPLLRLAPFQASTPAKVRLALAAVRAAGQGFGPHS